MKNKKTFAILLTLFTVFFSSIAFAVTVDRQGQANSAQQEVAQKSQSSTQTVLIEKKNVPHQSAEFSKINEKVKASTSSSSSASEVKEAAKASSDSVEKAAKATVKEEPAPAEAPTPASSTTQGSQAPQAPAETPAPPAVPAQAPTPEPAPVVKVNTMSFLGYTFEYRHGGQANGQSIIDNNPQLISTWGGAATGSTTDGLSTHFIGHNPGIFSPVMSLTVGATITVTDGNGNTRNYQVNRVMNVDDYAVGLTDGIDHWEEITGTGGGERIVLQTCINDTTNRIVMAA